MAETVVSEEHLSSTGPVPSDRLIALWRFPANIIGLCARIFQAIFATLVMICKMLGQGFFICLSVPNAENVFVCARILYFIQLFFNLNTFSVPSSKMKGKKREVPKQNMWRAEAKAPGLRNGLPDRKNNHYTSEPFIPFIPFNPLYHPIPILQAMRNDVKVFSLVSFTQLLLQRH